MTIQSLTLDQLPEFLEYLQDHISDNGKDGAPKFLPIPRAPEKLPDSLRESLTKGHLIPIGEFGWRRMLVARNSENEFMGHIDLASLSQNGTEHRARLGMGVHRDHRGKGLGQQLVAAVIEWAKRETEIEHIDLFVLTINPAAIKLYRKMGFEEYGHHQDKFRIDGESLSTIMMTLKIDRS